jgi:hypothetical protein
MKTQMITFTAIFVGVGFLLLPFTQAVVPPPDGGYAGFTTAEGTNALKNLTTGSGNTAVGWYSLFSNSTGSFSTGIGGGALALNDGDSNTALGAAALLLNTTGDRNTALGESALLNNATGAQNVAIGVSAMRNGNGFGNVAVGQDACRDNGAASGNTGVGYLALLQNQAADNTGIGNQALVNNTTGDHNVATGAFALDGNTTGSFNTAVGYESLSHADNTGGGNTAIGYRALPNNTTGNENTAVGDQALRDNNNDHNTAVGEGALASNTTGAENTAIGVFAGINQVTGSDNVYIGEGVDGVDGENNQTRIRNVGSTPIVGGINVVVADTGGLGDQILGYASSSRRYKKAITPMGSASETLFALKPVTFRAKAKTAVADVKHYGLIAEDVAMVDPDLVVYNQDGKPETLRFDSINAMLLNEFLKEHKRVDELTSISVKQESMIAELKEDLQTASIEHQKEIQFMSAKLKEQAAQIQRVSAQLELDKRGLLTAQKTTP